MIYIDKITKRSDLENNESLTTYDGEWEAQQNYKAFETFFYFLKEVRPTRILEVGTSKGGFTYFLNESCKVLNLDCHILSLDINEYPWYPKMIESGIDKFIIIGENVLNYHYSDDCYYEEWFDEVEEGWIAMVNFHDHVIREFETIHIDHYFVMGGELEEIEWRTYLPMQLFRKIGDIVIKRIS